MVEVATDDGGGDDPSEHRGKTYVKDPSAEAKAYETPKDIVT